MTNLFFSASQKTNTATNTANSTLVSEKFNAKSLLNTDGASFKEMLVKQENTAVEKASAERKSQEKISQPQAKQVEPDHQIKQNEQNQQKYATDNQPPKAQPATNKKLATSAKPADNKQAQVKPSNQLDKSSTQAAAEKDVKLEEQVTDTAKLSAENLFAILNKTKISAEKLKENGLKEDGTIDAPLSVTANQNMIDTSLLSSGLNLAAAQPSQLVTSNITPEIAQSGLINSAGAKKDTTKDGLSDDALADLPTDKFKRDGAQKGGRDVDVVKADIAQLAKGDNQAAKQLDNKNNTLLNNADQTNQGKVESQFSNSLMMLSQPNDIQNMTQLATSVPLTQAGNTNQIGIPLGKNGWDQAVSQRIMLMVGSSEQTATLTLNPPDLGPLQVVVHVHNGQADTTFITDHTHVRNALENSLGTLQNMMEQAGVNMGSTAFSNSQSHLSHQQNQQSSNQSRQTANSGNNLLNNNIESSTVGLRPLAVIVRQGLVDTFA